MSIQTFTKWVEAVPTWHIKQKYGSSFGQQFKRNKIKDQYASYRVKHALSTPRNAKSNGQAEASNKAILNNLKNTLDVKKDLWAQELINILCASNENWQITI